MAHVLIYHDPAVGLTDEAMVDLACRSWRDHGWEVRLVNQIDAQKHPLFHRLFSHIQGFGTSNPRDYEAACFLRWLVAAQYGGVMSDTDVVNYGVRPKSIEFLWDERVNDGMPLGLERYGVPCVVAGTRAQFERVVEAFLAKAHTPAHVSDMTVFQSCGHWDASEKALCAEFWQDEAWRKASLVHYSTGSIHRYGRGRNDKVAVIEKERRLCQQNLNAN